MTSTTKLYSTLCVMVPFLAGCATIHETPLPEVRVNHFPPSEVDVVESLIRSGDVPVNGNPLCEELAGSNSQTIGGYVAHLLAMQTEGGDNSVWVGIDDGGYVEPGFLEAHVIFSSGTKQEPSSWGVQFLIRKKDGLVMSESFRCTVPW